MTSSAEERNLLRRGTAEGSDSARGVWIPFLLINPPSLVCLLRLQLGTANTAREDASNASSRPPMADSCSVNVTIFGPQGSEALRETSWGNEKRGQRRNRRASRLAVIFCLPLMSLPLSLATKRRLRPFVGSRQCALTPCWLPPTRLNVALATHAEADTSDCGPLEVGWRTTLCG